jgi:hypothetical protein
VAVVVHEFPRIPKPPRKEIKNEQPIAFFGLLRARVKGGMVRTQSQIAEIEECGFRLRNSWVVRVAIYGRVRLRLSPATGAASGPESLSEKS